MHDLPFLDIEALNLSHLLSSPHTHLAPAVPAYLKHGTKLPCDLCTFSLPGLFFLLLPSSFCSNVTLSAMSLTIPCQKQSPLPSLPLFLSPNFILHSAYHLTLHFCICQLSLHTAGFGPRRQGFGVFYSLSYPQQIDQKLALDPYFKKKKNLLNK